MSISLFNNSFSHLGECKNMSGSILPHQRCPRLRKTEKRGGSLSLVPTCKNRIYPGKDWNRVDEKLKNWLAIRIRQFLSVWALNPDFPKTIVLMDPISRKRERRFFAIGHSWKIILKIAEFVMSEDQNAPDQLTP